MFVKDFKKIQIKPVDYPSKVKVYKWDQKTKKLKKQDYDWQVEINKNKHIELKEMLAKNILPNSDNKGFYGDTRPFKNMTIQKLYNATTNIMFSKKEPAKNDVKVDAKKDAKVEQKTEVKTDETKV